jgi:hypothetical protein
LHNITMDDDTGYKRPPKAHQFKPGKSGNPRGRPKGTRNLSTDLAEISSRRVPIRENGKERRTSRQEAVLLSLYNKALHGDVKAATSIINMLIKLSPQDEAAPETSVSETDQLIVENFLRRHATTPKDVQS